MTKRKFLEDRVNFYKEKTYHYDDGVSHIVNSRLHERRLPPPNATQEQIIRMARDPLVKASIWHSLYLVELIVHTHTYRKYYDYREKNVIQEYCDRLRKTVVKDYRNYFNQDVDVYFNLTVHYSETLEERIKNDRRYRPAQVIPE